MARTALTVTNFVEAGITHAAVAAHVDGNMWDNTGTEVLMVINGSGGSINVTIQTQQTVNGLAIADRVVAVGAGVTKFIGSFQPLNLWNVSGGADNGKIYVDYSAVTSVTVAVYRGPW